MPRATDYAIGNPVGGRLFGTDSAGISKNFYPTTAIQPEDFGVTGAGGAADQAAWLLVANYLNTYGGVLKPHRPYIMDWHTNLGFGVLTSFYLWGDNIALDLTNARFTFNDSIAGYRPFFFFGGGRLGTAWQSARCYSATTYAISGTVSKGDISLTLTTAAHAAHFAVGDIAYLRTGQTGSFTATAVTEPSAELLEVASSNSSTGVVTLKSPVTRTYVQEYFVSGTGGKSTSNVTANPAIYGLANVTDRIMRNFRMEGGHLHAALAEQVLSLWGCWDAKIFTSIDHPRNGYGSADVRGLEGEFYNHHAGVQGVASPGYYWVSLSTGTSHSRVRLEGFSDTQARLEIHEGCAQSTFTGSVVCVGDSVAGTPTVEVAARAYDVEIRDLYIDSGITDVRALSIDSDSSGGGKIKGLTVRNQASNTSAILINAANWEFADDPKMLGPNSMVSLRGLQQTTAVGHIVGARRPIMALTKDKLSSSVAAFHPYDAVSWLQVEVIEAFNAGANNTISVGYSGDGDAFLSVFDVSSTSVTWIPIGHADAGTLLGKQVAPPTITGPHDFVATFNGTGSAATTGKVLIKLDAGKTPRLD